MYNTNKLLKTFVHKKINRKHLNSKWYGVDSIDNFIINSKTNFDKLKYYIENPIEYKWNSDKFRSDFEFTSNKKIDVDIYLGCSHTMGTGHHWENTWPYHISQFTKNKIVNLGIAGKGIEISFINLSKYINYFNVINVFHYQPIYARYTYPYKNKIGSVLIQNVNLDTSDEDYLPWKKSYIKAELINDDYIVYNHYKHTLSIEGLCKHHNIPYFHLHEIPKINSTKETIMARDLIHYNTTQLKFISNKFIDKVKTHPMGYNEMIDMINNTELI